MQEGSLSSLPIKEAAEEIPRPWIASNPAFMSISTRQCLIDFEAGGSTDLIGENPEFEIERRGIVYVLYAVPSQCMF